jgi:hypothetical protein
LRWRSKEGQASGLFVILQRVGLRLAVIDRAVDDLALAGPAGAVLAAVGQRQALAQRGVEQGFVCFGGKLLAARLNGDLVAHKFPLVVGYNAGVQKILIVGSGDVARRILSRLAHRARVYALLRDAAKAAEWRAAGARPVLADLDDRRSLQRIAGLADVVLHLAPPPGEGRCDTRTRNLLAALGKAKSLPRRLIYVSTTGVYGDCGGAQDRRNPSPESRKRARRPPGRCRALPARLGWSARGARCHPARAGNLRSRPSAGRAAAKRPAGAWSRLTTCSPTTSMPTTSPPPACAALRHGRANRVYNVVDDSDLKMAEYFDRVADAFALPRPPRISRAEA